MFGICVKGSGWLLNGEGMRGSKGESGEARVIVGKSYNSEHTLYIMSTAPDTQYFSRNVHQLLFQKV